MSRRVAVAASLGVLGALALVGLYLGIVSWAQGSEHAFELLWGDRLFVGLISAGFGTQVGLFAYVRMLRRSMARESLALAGAGTATSSVSMIACCAHHLADVLPVIGLSGLAIALNDFRTPLMVVGIATNLAGIGVMIRELRWTRARYRVVVRDSSEAA